MKNLLYSNFAKIKRIDIPVRFLLLQIMVLITFICLLAI